MEPKFKTSFIPKQPISGSPARKKRGGVLPVISLIAIVLILSVVALAVGVFLYQKILIATIERKNDTLERARAAFEPALIQELVRLDARINSAKEILNSHVAPSTFFNLLERTTLRSVAFKSLTYTRLSDERIGINMEGEARSFNGVALQADIFGRERSIREPIFSGLNLNQVGNVVFEFSAFLDPSLIRFAENVDTGFQVPEEEVTEEES